MTKALARVKERTKNLLGEVGSPFSSSLPSATAPPPAAFLDENVREKHCSGVKSKGCADLSLATADGANAHLAASWAQPVAAPKHHK